jgi:CBS domain-containing protein
MAAIPAIGKFAIANPHTISCEDTLLEAERRMSSHRIRHLPVMDGKKIYGVISDRDISLAKAVHAGRAALREIYVKDICVYDPYVVDEHEPLDSVLSTMAKRRYGSVIVTREGAICGIFTTMDACRLLATAARGEAWNK